MLVRQPNSIDMNLIVDPEKRIYHNVRIIYDSSFDIIQYTDIVMDTEQPFLVTYHQHPKKGDHHWHVVGVFNKPHGHHLARHTGLPHPRGGKPINCKPKLYDHGAFDYCLKPKEWVHDDCVVLTNVSEVCLEEAARRSQIVWDLKAHGIDSALKTLTPPEDGEEFTSYYAKAFHATMEQLLSDDPPGLWQPHFKYKILMNLYANYPQYRANVAKCLM